MLTDRRRAEENTGVQESAPYNDRYAMQSDFVMVYGIGNDLPGRVREYARKGYIVHLMTGVSWGEYTDYLEGDFDGRRHWDEAQVDRAGRQVLHGPGVPYMIPTDSFADYLINKIKPAIDEGVYTIHMEEPEIWVHSGYGEAFKRAWRVYYREDWTPPHESADAYYRAAKLKYYLYARMLGRVAFALKEYAMARYGKSLRFIVPTHSLINYTQFGIVSPESALMDDPSVDGYIAQVWTGTSRVPNVYHGRRAERIFECSFLEYGVMQELIRGTSRKMWLLQDPIEDNPVYTWESYRKLYLEGLTAALLQPKIHQYEVCPWPRRVFLGKYPRAGGVPMPKEYGTLLMSTSQALRDMAQPYEWLGADAGVGVLIADSAMFERNYSFGVELRGPYPEKGEEGNLSPFYGLTLPLLRRGVHVMPVQLDNIRRQADYLRDYRVLALSYEFMKPQSPDIHLALAMWVREGGALVIIGDGSDDFHAVREWWTKSGYRTPTEHLCETLELGRDPAERLYTVGKGIVAVRRLHPSALAYDARRADEYLDLIRSLSIRQGLKWEEKNYFALRRGPYVIAQVMEDEGGAPFKLEGDFVNLYDPNLGVLHSITLQPGENILAADLSLYPQIALVGSAGRVEDYEEADGRVSFLVKCPLGVPAALRVKCPPPLSVKSDARVTHTYDQASGTLLLRLSGHPDGRKITLSYELKERS